MSEFPVLEAEIGLCSEIMSLAMKLDGSKMKNAILKNVGGYRQGLRDVLYDLEEKQSKAKGQL